MPPSRTDYSRSEDIGAAGEHAFAASLRRWFCDGSGGTEFIRIDTPYRDRHSIDLRTHITWSNDPRYSVAIDWQVKTTDKDIVPPTVKLTKNAAERILTNRNPSFLVCGIPARRLLSLDDPERYDWYVIDLRQYLKSKYKTLRFADIPREIEVRFPAGNYLNARLASLLWGAAWFRGMTNSVRDRPALIDVNRSLLRHLSESAVIDRREFTRLHGMCKEDLSSGDYFGDIPDANYVMGTVYLAAWLMRYHEEIPDKDYSSFGIEGISPALNLWLFSRSHRLYYERLNTFYKSGPAAAKLVMPIASDIEILPNHFRCTYINVACMMRVFGLRLSLDRRSPATWGKGILFSDRSSFAGVRSTVNDFIDTDTTFDVRPAWGRGYTNAEVYESLRPKLWMDHEVNFSELKGRLRHKDLILIETPKYLFPTTDDWFDLPKELWHSSLSSRLDHQRKPLLGW
ncbi:MAG: hypothetical protein NTU79_09295 [Planctomycetota bacterium]|nr:hypothetical protein [Planctomycetota bacterium]